MSYSYLDLLVARVGVPIELWSVDGGVRYSPRVRVLSTGAHVNPCVGISKSRGIIVSDLL